MSSSRDCNASGQWRKAEIRALGEPHLHFGVYQFWPAAERLDVAVHFRNAKGPLDGRRGLVPGHDYKALPY